MEERRLTTQRDVLGSSISRLMKRAASEQIPVQNTPPDSEPESVLKGKLGHEQFKAQLNAWRSLRSRGDIKRAGKVVDGDRDLRHQLS